MHGITAALAQFPPYTALADPGLLDYWLFSDQVPGLVASSSSAKNAWAMRQPVGGAQPTYGLTALVGPLGATAPGLLYTASNKGLFCSAAGYQAAIAALSSVDVYVVCSKSALATAALLEHTSAGVNPGGFGILCDSVTTNSLEFDANFTGTGTFRSLSTVAPLSDPGLVFGGFSNPGLAGTGTTARRIDQIDIPGSNISTGVLAGNYAAASNLNLGARNGGTSLSWSGVIASLWLFQSGTPSQIERRAQYIAGLYPGILTVA